MSQNPSGVLDARIEELRQRLEEIEHASDDDLPLGKANTRRDLLIQAAIDAPDSILMGFTDGSIEELNYLLTCPPEDGPLEVKAQLGGVAPWG